MNLTVLAIVAVLELPLLIVVGKVLFGGWREFLDACESLFVSDLSAALSGVEPEHRGGRFLLLLFLAFACVSMLVGYYLVSRYWA